MKQINLINFIQEKNKELNKVSKFEEQEENDVSELHFHKILFILYGSFYAKFNKELFNPNFKAWKNGPVEQDYHLIKKENKNNLKIKFNFKFETNIEKEYLTKITIKLLKFSPWSLVEYTHSLDAWINNYIESQSKEIPKKDIIRTFKKNKKHYQSW